MAVLLPLHRRDERQQGVEQTSDIHIKNPDMVGGISRPEMIWPTHTSIGNDQINPACLLEERRCIGSHRSAITHIDWCSQDGGALRLTPLRHLCQAILTAAKQPEARAGLSIIQRKRS